VTCRHCQLKAASRPLGLCWTCYFTPGVRVLYGSESKYAPQYADFYGLGALPEPTDTIQGTPERAAVLAERVTNRQQLHHPGDRKL
jgi:hypothetical protein